MARETGKWFAALGLFAAMLIMLVTLQVYHATSRGVADPALRRAAAALTEIDPWIDANYDTLQESAEASSPGEAVPLPDYPIDLGFVREDVAGVPQAQLRAKMLERSADALYDGGTDALRADDGASVARFTSAGVVDTSVDLLRERNHDASAVVLVVFAAMAVALAGVLGALTRGFGRAVALGLTVIAASLPVLLGGIALRLYMAAGSDASEEYPRPQLLDIGEALAWIPVRNGMAFVALGAVLLIIGVAGAMTSRGGSRTAFGRA